MQCYGKKLIQHFVQILNGPHCTSFYTSYGAWLEHHSRSLGFFIDEKFVLPADRRSRSLNDGKGGVVCSVACAEEADISQCAASSVSGFKAWSGLSCERRAKVLLKLVSLLGQHTQCVSELCELCDASASPSALVRLLQYYSGWAQLRDTLITGWTPLGVVEVVTSDDCSLYSLMLKVLPALAMGNSVIVVPGWSCGPPALLLAHLFTGAGLPAGALNVLTGCDMTLGAKVAQNPNVSYVTYSGNKQDGVTLCESTAGMGVPVSVSPYIGATCPFIIFESADIDSAVEEVIEAAFKKRKEVNWVLCVQESVYDSVVARLRLRMSGLKCVALLRESDSSLVEAAVQEAQQQGATLVQSSAAPPSRTHYPPTVLCGAAPSSPCVVSPSPGPLLPLMTFRSNSEAVTLGNHSPHGQAASIWTEDLTLALETAKSLSVGSVWVNSHSVFDPCLPVSGHKDSGTCTDGGQEGLYQYLRPSSSTPSLPRSSPASLDYSAFGTETPAPIIPVDLDSAPQSLLQLVGGKTCKSVSGCSMAVRPQEGTATLGYCPYGGRKDVRNAVEAAIKVQPGWMKKTPSVRAQSLYSLAKALEAKMRVVAGSNCIQTSISVEEANAEVDLSVARLNLWAAYCDKVQGGSLPMPKSGSALSFPEALGVVGVILPDKHPLLSMATLLGAAIATGNAVILVPSEKYPLPVLSFIQVLQASDLPAGLVNVITGSRDQLAAAFANHSVIKAVWYWGSAEGCQYLQKTCTRPLKTLKLSCQTEEDWTQSDPALLEELWRNAVQWKSVWIPTA
uniref:Aldehyde dehydrogenase domain-containing protein n=1 Tax=Salarias fasciatus TaxID=181472 RepID=A0A672G192_SALFA